MKKYFRLFFAGFIALSMLSNIAFADVTSDNSTDSALTNEAEMQDYSVITMYAPDGRTVTVYKAEQEAWQKVGWYVAPVITMYAPDGRTVTVYKTEQEAWQKVGWYDTPVTTMCAPDGRTVIVYKAEAEAWEKVGWYEIISGDDTYVNQQGLSSKTDFLVWVSKHEYKVRVYAGSKGNWNLINEFTCTIGKPSTPTCEGTYRYYQAQKMWDYDTYYVGPIMRFNGGYAIHSTLIYKDGTPKDDRVGMELSLGCVRLQPPDINWMASVVPLNTTIHITA